MLKEQALRLGCMYMGFIKEELPGETSKGKRKAEQGRGRSLTRVGTTGIWGSQPTWILRGALEYNCHSEA